MILPHSHIPLLSRPPLGILKLIDLATLPSCDPTPPEDCGNHGLAFAVQPHPFKNDNTNFPELSVTYFHNAKVEQDGFTNYIGFTNSQTGVPFSIYGGAPISTESIAVNHRGYFLAPISGLYKIAFKNTDDNTFFWIGESAYNGNYNARNAAYARSVSQPHGSYQGILIAGEYYPFRVLFVNGYDPTAFDVEVTDPMGNVIVSSTVAANTCFFQFTCDYSSPPFDPFGAEKET